MPKVAPWLRSFERLLVNRSRPYALQEKDGSYRWAYQRCTPNLLEAHLRGEITLAMSSLDASGLCKWLCLDADAPDGLAKLMQIRLGFDGLGWPSMLEASRRGGISGFCSVISLRRSSHGRPSWEPSNGCARRMCR